jgi:hypothetical protein
LLSLGTIRVKSLSLDEGDLARFLGEQSRNLQGIQVRLSGGAVTAKASWGRIPLEASVRLYLTDPSAPNLGFQVLRLRAAGLPLPAWLANLLAGGFNPLLKTQGTPLKLDFQGLEIEGGRLRLFCFESPAIHAKISG